MRKSIAPLFLLFSTVFFLYPVIVDKTASFCIEQDNVHQGYAFFSKLNSSLHKGYLPVWDANTYGGRSFAGEIQPGIFYPLNILWCLLFGTVRGVDVYYLDLLVCFHYLVCALGMYFLARRLKLSVPGSVFASLIFTFTGALSFRSSAQTWTFFGLTWLPWVVYHIAGHYLMERRKKYLVWAGLTAGLQILAGHIEPFYHTILICGIVVCFYEFHGKTGWVNYLCVICIKVGVIILIAFLLALPQLYYTAQYLPHSYRYVSGGYYIKMGQKVPKFIYTHWFVIGLQNLGNFFGKTLAQPDDGNLLYMGILPLFFVGMALLKRKALAFSSNHLRLITMLLVIISIGLLSVLGYVTLFCQFLYYFPLVNGIRELGRYSILISFGASLLAGLVVTQISEFKGQFSERAGAAGKWVTGVVAVNGLYLVFFQSDAVSLPIAVPYVLCAIFLLLSYLRLISGQQYAAVAVVFLVADIFLNDVNFLSTRYNSYPTNYYAKNKILDFLKTTYGRYRVSFQMKDYSEVRRSIGDIYDIQTKWGYAATVEESYFQFVTGRDGSDPQKDDLLNVRYILADQALDSSYIYKDSIPHLLLYERRNYYPRCYWRHQVGKPGVQIEEENKEMVMPLEYSDLYQKVQVNCSSSDTLVFSENYYPGWECFDNGKRVSIFKWGLPGGHPLFRAVYLDRGHHLLEMRYNKVFYFF